MAYGVKGSPKRKLHQAVHGYVDGHRQLALSTTLKPRDQKTLLTLSDISGPGATLEPEGYLTGYPLTESGFYALARTWPAPEMSRPGCVWTHTLLVDFTDLASLEALTGLSTLFLRPLSAATVSEFDIPIRIQDVENGDGFGGDESWAKRVIAALYGKPRGRVIAARPKENADAVVLKIWSQQWPRLRRNFRFCTFTTSDRSTEGSSFDLQLVPYANRNVRSRFSDVVDSDLVDVSSGVWLEDALRDLDFPDSEGLRSFFRRLGSDAPTGREAFRPLCQLHRTVNAFLTNPSAVNDAIAVLNNEFGVNQPKTARLIVAKAALEVVDALDDLSFEFLWSSLELLDQGSVTRAATRVGRSAWRRNPQLLAHLAEGDGQLVSVVDLTLAELELPELIDGLRQAPGLTAKALAKQPELVGQSAFWSDIRVVDEAFEAARRGNLQMAAITAMLDAGRDELATRSVKEFGSEVVLVALKSNSDAAGVRTKNWVQEAARDTSVVARFLANEDRIHRAMLCLLARTLAPDAVPNEFGTDPWLTAWQNSVGSVDDVSNLNLKAYFLSRALGGRSKSPGELVQLSFETIHSATAANLLPDEGWHILEPKLPWLSFWFAWDRCRRIRTAVTHLFVENNLPPLLFARLVQDDQLFGILAEGAMASSQGWDYLKRARQAMKDDGDFSLSGRIRTIEKLLD